MIKKCARCLAVSSENNWQKKNTRERKNSFGNYAPKTHAEHREVTNAESRMETAVEKRQQLDVGREGGLYNCCKEVWLGGQRNNQLKALMASDGVAVQGRWNQRLGLELEWEVGLTVGLGL